MPLLGAHLSISGGFSKIKSQCDFLKCDTFQIFTKNQLRWDAPPIEEQDLRCFREFLAENGISRFVVHSSYLINIASLDKKMWQKSVEALIIELQRAEILGASVFVLHPGSPKKESSIKEGIKRAIDALCIALELSRVQRVKLAVENTAGAGYLLGRNLHELLAIVDGVERCGKEIGVCIDTAHAYQSGYTLDERFIDELYGLFKDRILTFHVNDSMTLKGSRKDRHANIGRGHIPLDFFKLLLNDKRFEGIPFILETPGGLSYFKMDLQTLRSLLNG